MFELAKMRKLRKLKGLAISRNGLDDAKLHSNLVFRELAEIFASAQVLILNVISKAWYSGRISLEKNNV